MLRKCLKIAFFNRHKNQMLHFKHYLLCTCRRLTSEINCNFKTLFLQETLEIRFFQQGAAIFKDRIPLKKLDLVKRNAWLFLYYKDQAAVPAKINFCQQNSKIFLENVFFVTIFTILWCHSGCPSMSSIFSHKKWFLFVKDRAQIVSSKRIFVRYMIIYKIKFYQNNFRKCPEINHYI